MPDLQWLSALDTAAAVRAGQVSLTEVVDATIERIERLDPVLASVVIPLFERARDRAGAAVGERAFGGVPTLLKDVGEEIAGTPSWAGTRGLATAGYVSSATTGLARRFEDLGFAIVGKSACPELSASSTTEPAGLPPTRNPWDLERTAGGSSGGAAAAVAAGLVPLAHGSDATGSLRFPASHCGVVTLKPSRGRVPITPPTGQRDPLGVWTQFALARDVDDLRALFPLVSTVARSMAPWRGPLRVGLLDHNPMYGPDLAPECAAAVHEVGAHLAAIGHRVELAFPPALTSVFKPFWKAMSVIAPVVRREQTRWMSQRLGRPCGPDDLTDEVLEQAARAEHLEPDAIAAAYEAVRAAMAPLPAWWSEFDLLVTPVALQAAWRLGEDAPIRTGMFCAPFSFTGQPCLVVPALVSDEGLPVGAQLVGRIGDDENLLELGSELQPMVGWLERRPPAPPVVGPARADA